MLLRRQNWLRLSPLISQSLPRAPDLLPTDLLWTAGLTEVDHGGYNETWENTRECHSSRRLCARGDVHDTCVHLSFSELLASSSCWPAGHFPCCPGLLPSAIRRAGLCAEEAELQQAEALLPDSQSWGGRRGLDPQVDLS